MDSMNQIEAQRLRYLAQLVTPPKTFAAIEILVNVTRIILGWFSITLEVFFRREFGERYFSTLRLMIAWGLLGTFTFFYSLFSIMAGGNAFAFFAYSGGFDSLFNTGTEGLTYHLFYYSWVMLAVLHTARIWKRNRDGVRWHTMCFGISHLSAIPWARITSRIPVIGKHIVIDDWWLYKWGEPTLALLIAYLIEPVNGLLSAWLTIGSVCLFFHNHMVYAQERDKALSLMDASIESSYLSQALAGHDKQQLAGLVVVPAPMDGAFDDGAFDLAATVRDTLGLADSES